MGGFIEVRRGGLLAALCLELSVELAAKRCQCRCPLDGRPPYRNGVAEMSRGVCGLGSADLWLTYLTHCFLA